MMKTRKWYYLCHMRSAYFPLIGDYIERERESKREKETDREREKETDRERKRDVKW